MSHTPGWRASHNRATWPKFASPRNPPVVQAAIVANLPGYTNPFLLARKKVGHVRALFNTDSNGSVNFDALRRCSTRIQWYKPGEQLVKEIRFLESYIATVFRKRRDKQAKAREVQTAVYIFRVMETVLFALHDKAKLMETRPSRDAPCFIESFDDEDYHNAMNNLRNGFHLKKDALLEQGDAVSVDLSDDDGEALEGTSSTDDDVYDQADYQTPERFNKSRSFSIVSRAHVDDGALSSRWTVLSDQVLPSLREIQLALSKGGPLDPTAIKYIGNDGQASVDDRKAMAKKKLKEDKIWRDGIEAKLSVLQDLVSSMISQSERTTETPDDWSLNDSSDELEASSLDSQRHMSPDPLLLVRTPESASQYRIRDTSAARNPSRQKRETVASTDCSVEGGTAIELSPSSAMSISDEEFVEGLVAENNGGVSPSIGIKLPKKSPSRRRLFFQNGDSTGYQRK